VDARRSAPTGNSAFRVWDKAPTSSAAESKLRRFSQYDEGRTHWLVGFRCRRAHIVYLYLVNPRLGWTYSLRQGIDDGFVAPYRVYRIASTVDAARLPALEW
jgi:hypothetical protein